MGGEKNFAGINATVFYETRKYEKGTKVINVEWYFLQTLDELSLAGVTSLKVQPPQILLKKPLHVGSKWNSRGSMNYLSTGGVAAEYITHGLVEKEEKIIVPAGTFQAMKVVLSSKFGRPKEQHQNIWLVKNIGIIKKEINSQMNRLSYELIHYWIPDQPLPTSEKIVIRSNKGEVNVNNFFKTAKKESSGSFLLKETSDYSFSFFGSDNGFLIVLARTPLRSSREKAETALLSILGISKDDVCKLPLHVGVMGSVDPNYAGRNLGVSFCPDGIAFDEPQIAEKKNNKEIAKNTNISRTIEGFNLGMSLSKAKQVVNQDGYNWGGKNNNSSPFFNRSSKFCIKTKYRPKYKMSNRWCEYVPVVKSKNLRTKTSSSIELAFYQARLYKIVIYPLAKTEVIEKALWQKYGHPKDRKYFMGGSMELNQTWYYGKTRLRFQMDTNYLRYTDIELEQAAYREVERIFYKREEERLKKEKTLPKGY